MSDITFTRSGEFEVTIVQGNSEAGVEMIDGWLTGDEMIVVVDAGRIVLANAAAIPAFEKAAEERGLTVEQVDGDG